MKFHEYITAYSYLKHLRVRGETVLDFYDRMREHCRLNGTPFDVGQAVTEQSWYRATRPYYKLWPRVAEALSRVSLNVSINELGIEPWTFCVRCPSTKLDGFRALLCSIEPRLWLDKSNTEGGIMVAAICDDDLIQPTMGILNATQQLEEQIGLYSVSEIMVQAYRMCIGVLLLKNDPDFVKPEVLASDQTKFEATKDPKYLEKAKARGVVGWNVGKDVEMSPHIRVPHFGLRWTGPGGEVPKIVPIKGSIIHKELLTHVPTGYIGPDDKEYEVHEH